MMTRKDKRVEKIASRLKIEVEKRGLYTILAEILDDPADYKKFIKKEIKNGDA